MFSKLGLAIMNPFLPWTHCPQGKGALKLTTAINILVFTWPDWKRCRCAQHLTWGSRVSSPPFLLPMLTMLFGSFFILSHHRSLPKLESAPDRLTATIKKAGFFFFFLRILIERISLNDNLLKWPGLLSGLEMGNEDQYSWRGFS